MLGHWQGFVLLLVTVTMLVSPFLPLGTIEATAERNGTSRTRAFYWASSREGPNLIQEQSKNSALPKFIERSGDAWQSWYYFLDADNDGFNDTFWLWFLITVNNTNIQVNPYSITWYRNVTDEDASWSQLEVPSITDQRIYKSLLLGWVRFHFPRSGEYRCFDPSKFYSNTLA